MATAYSTLDRFTEAGLRHRFAVDRAKAYFDINPTEHHQFFLEKEGEIVDMPSLGPSVADLPEVWKWMASRSSSACSMRRLFDAVSSRRAG
ncbi:transcriptional repressor [Microvirga zambiensis]|uniref:transcriptional repressor n=1 Tax=Microvirga zambiensis TaxID=1402137 RepID=UPI003CCDE5AF